MKDHTDTIKSCAISFLCVCENLMEKQQLDSWAKGETNPNDYMDANVILDQIMVNHGIDTFNEDGEITDEIADLFNACFNMTNELNANKRKPKKFEVSYQYSLGDLQSSINDICSQWHSAKIDTKEAKALARKCCAEFLIKE